MKSSVTIVVLLVVLAVVLFGSGALGTRDVSMLELLSGRLDETDWRVLAELRWPRIIAALIAGVGLAAAGVITQTVLDNRLADPGLVGVNAGAALAGVLLISFSGFAPLPFVLACLAGAMISALVILRIATRPGGATTPYGLIVAGMALSAVLGGVSSMIALSDPLRFASLRTWLVGSLAGRDWSMVAVAAPIVAIGIVAAFALARSLDALSLGRRKAAALGLPAPLVVVAAVLLVAVLAGTAVALAGPVAFLGLAVPHVARRLTRGGHANVLGAAALIGAILLVLADVAARTALSPTEIPVSLLVAVIGVPVFLFVVVARSPRDRVRGFGHD